MSISRSRALSGVHPWLKERILYMDAFIESWGGKQVYISGVRDRKEQQRLFELIGARPAAAPGCSQHQYGYAVDVFWNPIMDFQRNVGLTSRQTVEVMEELGRRLDLILVSNDAGHFQVFPGAEFKNWAVASGFCDPTAVRRTAGSRLGSQAFQICGPGFATVRGNTLRGFVCSDPF